MAEALPIEYGTGATENKTGTVKQINVEQDERNLITDTNITKRNRREEGMKNNRIGTKTQFPDSHKTTDGEKQKKVEIKEENTNNISPKVKTKEGIEENGIYKETAYFSLAQGRSEKDNQEILENLNPFHYSQPKGDQESHNPFQEHCTSLTDTMEAALTCGVCLREFDSEYRRPILLPSCGHTFCRTCVKGLALRDAILYCPTCRQQYKDVEVDNFPINFSLQILTSCSKDQRRVKPPDVSQCSAHGVRLAFWCRSCEVPACGECLYESHPQDTHDLCKIKEAVKEVKSKTEVLLKEAKREAKEQMAESLMRAQEGVWAIQEASDILQEASRICRSVEESCTLPSVAASFKKAKEMKGRLKEMVRGDVDGGAASPIASSLGIARPKWSCPLVVAQGEKGEAGKVQVEDFGVHVYSLHPPGSISYCAAVKLPILLESLNKASPRVFLDLKAGERPLGRIYIQLWGDMRRAQQFLTLCLGTLGPCYRDTRFDGVSNRGLPGEYVRGGDYSGKQGLGGEALMDNLEWGGEYSKPIKAGQVCGVGGEQKGKFGALFAICLRDNPSDNFRAPFGMVMSGMEVIEVACRHDPFDMVRISDCGVVVEM